MANITVRLPPLDELALRWSDVEGLLKRATDRSACYEPIDLLRLVMVSQGQIWIIERGSTLVAAAFSQVKDHPRRRLLEVPFIGGDGLVRWHRELLAALDDFARKSGCADIVGFGRPGWAKFGFEPDGILLTRRL